MSAVVTSDMRRDPFWIGLGEEVNKEGERDDDSRDGTAHAGRRLKGRYGDRTGDVGRQPQTGAEGLRRAVSAHHADTVASAAIM